MSAQFSRKKISGNLSGGWMPSTTSPVSRAGSRATPRVSTPSFASVRTTNSPRSSRPTFDTIAALSPSRAAPTATFPDEPPRYIENVFASWIGTPISLA